MSLKASHGNMYDWVSHMHSHLAGECPHKCAYCYVQRNPHGVSQRYKGELRLIKEELKINYGSGKTIFIEHMNDLFAEGVVDSWIIDILEHCQKYPDNKYVFQTKNPDNAFMFLKRFHIKNILIGTTIESNREYKELTRAPNPFSRYAGMCEFRNIGLKTFITIEPILDFDVNILSKWIIEIKPQFVNIGADSKYCHLPEPHTDKIRSFISALQDAGIIIKKKINLERILK